MRAVRSFCNGDETHPCGVYESSDCCMDRSRSNAMPTVMIHETILSQQHQYAESSSIFPKKMALTFSTAGSGDLSASHQLDKCVAVIHVRSFFGLVPEASNLLKRRVSISDDEPILLKSGTQDGRFSPVPFPSLRDHRNQRGRGCLDFAESRS